MESSLSLSLSLSRSLALSKILSRLLFRTHTSTLEAMMTNSNSLKRRKRKKRGYRELSSVLSHLFIFIFIFFGVYLLLRRPWLRRWITYHRQKSPGLPIHDTQRLTDHYHYVKETIFHMKHLYKLTPFMSRRTIGSLPSHHSHTGDAFGVGRTIFYFRLLHSRKTSKSEVVGI
ncbi:unnamed protein product [Camellia sinensis]